MIDDVFISKLPADPILALKSVAEHFQSVTKGMSMRDAMKDERDLIKIYAFSVALIRKHSINLGVSAPELEHKKEENVKALMNYFGAVQRATEQLDAQNFFKTSLAMFERELDVGFHYEFSDGEISRLQELITELRNAVTGAAYLDDDHRRRLLKRLEKLQAELHKRMSDLDVILGGVAEIGAAINRFGEDAKPLVARLREIGEIVAPVFRRAENLPPGPSFHFCPSPTTRMIDRERRDLDRAGISSPAHHPQAPPSTPPRPP